MKTIKLLALAASVAISGSVFAQKIKITQGTFAELKGQTEVNVVFDYSELTCAGGAPFASTKPKPEAEWLGAIVLKKNEKEAGTGDDFKKRWEAAKPGPFESSFEVKLAEDWTGVTCKRGLNNAKYTFVVKLRYADPGFSMGVSTADAWLSATIELVETGTKTVSSSLTMDQIKGAQAGSNAPGGFGMIAAVGGLTFEKRLGESFEKMGKSLYGKVLKKALK